MTDWVTSLNVTNKTKSQYHLQNACTVHANLHRRLFVEALTHVSGCGAWKLNIINTLRKHAHAIYRDFLSCKK